MKIAISGSTGFTGKALSAYLHSKGHEIIKINRQDFNNGIEEIVGKIKHSDCVINLAGSPIIKRWTKDYKLQIINSRVNTTLMLLEAIKYNIVKPQVFINASAIGIYASEGVHDEYSQDFDKGFLGEVCRKWENAALKAEEEHKIRTVIFRTGVVLGKSGGALAKVLPIFKIGFGAVTGRPEQPFSFIHIYDFCRAFLFAIENKEMTGVYNLTSPEISTNKKYALSIGSSLRRPVLLAIPDFALRLALSEAASVIIQSPAAIPERLKNEGFVFEYPGVDSAVDNIIKESKY